MFNEMLLRAPKKERFKIIKFFYLIMNQKFETRYVTLGICKYQDKHLLVKISPDYPYCPGDWDFIFSRSYEPDKSDEENIY